MCPELGRGHTSSMSVVNVIEYHVAVTQIDTSLSVCQVARATGEAKCHGSKLHKEVTEKKVYWFVCLNTSKIAKSKNGLFVT